MTLCQQAQQWLLQTDTPHVDHCSDPAVAEHLRACVECMGLSQALSRVEEAWRRQPLPAGCVAAQAAFLGKIAEPPQPVPPPRPRSPRPALLRWALAAAVLVGATAGLWSLLPERHQRHGDIVGRLIDWNLDLSQADNLERQRLFAREETVLKIAVDHASLSREDRDLADNLLAQADRLAKQEDGPLVHAVHFTELADKLVDRVDQAAHKANSTDMNRYVKQYRRVLERGVHPALAKVHNASLKDHDKKHRDKLEQRHLGRTRRLESLLKQAPAESRLELRQTLEMSHKPRPKGWKGKGKI